MITKIEDWIKSVYFPVFEKYIGFNADTFKKKLWMGNVEAKEINKKIELISPGLTQREDSETGEFHPTPFFYALGKRFEYERKKKREELGLVQSEFSLL